MLFKHNYNQNIIKAQAFLHKWPSPVLKNEPPAAKELRAALSGDIYFCENGYEYIFFNRLSGYPCEQCTFCDEFCNGYYRTISLSELKEYNSWLKVGNQFLYPMLVWVYHKNKPTLVRLKPGHKKPVKRIRRPIKKCIAYLICASKIGN